MPYLNLEIIVTTDRIPGLNIVLLNPHEEEDCDTTDEGSTHVHSCYYRALGLIAPFYFAILSPFAQDLRTGTCPVAPSRIYVHRLDTFEQYDVRRIGIVRRSACLYIAGQRPP